MNKSLLIAGLSAFFLISCNNVSVEEQMELIKKTEGELYSSKDKFDNAKADMLIRNYDQFATAHPDHELAATYLFRAGDLSTGLNKSDQAIDFFERVVENYPGFKKTPDAVFLIAFVYENQLKDFELAEEYYRAFLKDYPEHPMASSAEFSIQNLGIPAEDLIKSFEEKNAVDTSQVQP